MSLDASEFFKIKRKVDGIIERYKARLAAKGYNQNAVSTFMRLLARLSNLLLFV